MDLISLVGLEPLFYLHSNIWKYWFVVLSFMMHFILSVSSGKFDVKVLSAAQQKTKNGMIILLNKFIFVCPKKAEMSLQLTMLSWELITSQIIFTYKDILLSGFSWPRWQFVAWKLLVQISLTDSVFLSKSLFPQPQFPIFNRAVVILPYFAGLL